MNRFAPATQSRSLRVLTAAASLFVAALLIVSASDAQVAQSAKKKKLVLSGTYKGTAKSADGKTKYGRAQFVFKKNKLESWFVTDVPITCRSEGLTGFGFTSAKNVLKAYGLKKKDVTAKSGKLDLKYTQPSHIDSNRLKLKFGKKSGSGTLRRTPAAGELNTFNCSGPKVKFSVKKK